MCGMSADVLARAGGRRGGVRRPRRALPAGATRSLLPDARVGTGRPEDTVQETLLAAWRGLAGFRRRASLRIWLYTIATSRCPNTLRAASRRPRAEPHLDFELPEPSTPASRSGSSPTLTSCSKSWARACRGPDARYETKEAISLAFITGLPLLPARQRSAHPPRRARLSRR